MNVLRLNDYRFISLDGISFLSKPNLRNFVKEVFLLVALVKLWRNEHFVTKWLPQIYKLFHIYVLKYLMKNNAKE